MVNTHKDKILSFKCVFQVMRLHRVALWAPRASLLGAGGGEGWTCVSILTALRCAGLPSQDVQDGRRGRSAPLCYVGHRDTSIQPNGVGNFERYCPKPEKHSKYQSKKPDERPRGDFWVRDEPGLCHYFLGPLEIENPALFLQFQL